MKLNWGHKLVFFGVAFMLFVLGMVFYITQQKVELVDENYYEKGIRYQEELNKLNAIEGKDIEFSYTAQAEEIQIKLLPPAIPVKIHLYRPSDASLDQHREVITDSIGSVTLPASALAGGLWEVKMEWFAAGRTLTFTKAITVQ
jgi:hypothetical protein